MPNLIDNPSFEQSTAGWVLVAPGTSLYAYGGGPSLCVGMRVWSGNQWVHIKGRNICIFTNRDIKAKLIAKYWRSRGYDV